MRASVASLMLALFGAAAHGAITLVPWGHLFLAPLQSPTRVAAADIDGNGTVDLVVSCRDPEGRFGIIRRTREGAWSPLEIVEIDAQTDWIEIADMDADAIPDLVLSIRSGDGRFAVMRGLGAGVFAPPTSARAGRNPARLAVAQLDGDGAPDVALVNWNSASVQAWRQTTSDSYESLTTTHLQKWATAIPFPFGLAAADFDGDGDTDIASASIGTKSLAILSNTGDGQFGTVRSWTAPIVDAESIAIANIDAVDVDADGDIDIVSNGLMVLAAQRTVIWLNDGDAGFSARVVCTGVPQGSSWSVAHADMDRDGDDDLLLGSALPGKLTVAEVDPETVGEFVAMQTLSGGSFTREITPVDLDADGDIDVVTADIATHQVFIYQNVSGALAPPALAPPKRAGADDPDSRRVPPGLEAAALAEWLARWEAPEGGIAGSGTVGCGAGAGLCEEPHATPGCVRTLCCEAVCELNPLCCEVAWDQACVDAEEELCDEFNCPSAGACDDPHDTPGCNDESCCRFLCEFDPFCCDTAWDATCAMEASAYCGLVACQLPPDPAARVVNEFCYERLNEGCNRPDLATIAPACGEAYESSVTSDSPRDTDWFRLDALACARVRIRLETEFPLLALVVRGPCDGPLEVIAQCTLVPCASGHFNHGIAPGDYLVVSAANGDRPLRSGLPCDQVDPTDPPPDPADPPFVPGYFGLDYRVRFTPSPTLGDINEDGRVDGFDLTAVLSAWGTAGGADLDGNGIVDGFDLTAVLSNWTPQ